MIVASSSSSSPGSDSASAGAAAPPPSSALAKRNPAAALATLNSISSDLKRSSDAAGVILASAAAGDVYDGSGKQIKALLEHAKEIVVQLREVMESTHEIDFYDAGGQLPPYDALVHKLNDAFRHQKGINQMNAKLLSVNYLVNLSNVSKNRQLSRAVAEGQSQVIELQRTVCTLEDSVDFLTVEADVQRQTASRLKKALDDTRRLLDATMVEYRQELGRQREMIRKQTTVIGELYRSKFHQDFILDATIFLFCLWAANTTIVDVPLRSAVELALAQLRYWFPSKTRFVGGAVPPSTFTTATQRRQKAWSQQAAKLVLILVFVRRLRRGAAEYGIHNRIGATYPYISSMFAVFYAGFAKRISSGLSRPTSSSTTTPALPEPEPPRRVTD
ncbi:hypothetical protein BDZ88DRAFT_412484 [Geranomyces variabilis]|nr:hypothetical protein BDZ88DRAFT_412484 [Geranomyces variabilis]KAJ3133112.1 hypothetical protein HDU90_006455 [Geranomyces variabilis]